MIFRILGTIRILRSQGPRGRRSARLARSYQPFLERLEDWVLPTTYTVITAADSGTGSLRDMITQANNNPGLDTINFNIPGSGVHVIAVQGNGLPTITDSVILDATTQPGYSATPLIQLDGSSVATNVTGLWISAGGSTVKGLAISHFTGSGIVLQGKGNNLIQANYVGTDATGTTAQGNFYNGIAIIGGSSSNQLVQNVISANGTTNGYPAVGISDNGSNNNVLTGNIIGLDASGTKALGNGGVGVFLGNNTQGARIGTNGDGVNDAAERNVISANGYQGIAIQGSNNNIVAGNYLGTDKTGTVALGNGANGIWILAGSQGNRIGVSGGDTDAAGEGNLISGNTYSGVAISDPGTNGNVVAGNLIGTDVTGTLALPNKSGGLTITNGAQLNRIGTNGDGVGDALERNVISGNNTSGYAGIYIADSGTKQNTVAGNYVGVDATGTKALGNGGVGVYLANGAQSNLIGTDGKSADDAGEANVISGNPYQGVAIQGTSSGTNTTNNVVAGNFIGIDKTGTVALGNANNGIWVLAGAQSNRIGTNGIDPDSAGEANVIGGNAFSGIRISDPGSNLNTVAGNFLGTDKTGAVNLGNGDNGVTIANGAQSNQVGGSPALANTIAFNPQAGVVVTDSGTTGNSIRANSIYSNGALGIDLGWDGLTTNNAGNVDPGPNDFQNYPVLLGATPGTSTVVTGTLNSVASTSFTLDFYASPSPDPSFFGQGKRYLGFAAVTTNSTGNVSFSVTLPAASSTGEWISATATDPSGNTSEFSGSRQLPASPLTLHATTWTPIGPAPISSEHFFNGSVVAGRVSVAAADPTNANVMYIGADGGGVWKTTDWLDQSPVWAPLTDKQASLNFNNISYDALAVYPANPSIVFAAMSGPGGGILRSTDGGNSWTLLGNSLFNQVNFGSIAVNPTNSNIIYVSVWGGSAAGGIYETTNGGTTWTNLTAGIHTGAASDILMDPTNPSVLYAGLVQGGATNGIYKTTTGGTSWTPLNNGILSGTAVGVSIRLALAPSNTQDLYATVFDPALGNGTQGLPHRYLSTNGGSNWSAMASLPGTDESRYWHVVLAVDPTNPQIVYVNGDHTLYQSTNAGASWTALYGEDPVGVSFDKNGGLTMVGDRGIYRWAGGTAPFANKQGNLQNNELYTLTLDPTNPDIAYGIAQDEFNAIKFFGIGQWNFLSAGDEVGKILVDPAQPSRIYTFDPNNTNSFVFRSDDGGVTWVSAGSGIPTSTAGFNLAYTAQKAFVMDPSNVHRLLLGTDQVYETTNDGTSWAPLPSNPFGGQFLTALAIAPSAPNTIYAATADGRVYVTTNDGTSWTLIDHGLPLNSGGIVSIQVDPNNPKRVFMVPGTFPTSVFGSTHVWLTTTGGTTWTDIKGNLPLQDWTNSIAVDWRFMTPVLYAATARGVYRSLNQGKTWSVFGTGMPNVVVTDLQLVPGLDLLGAATYGRGVFEIVAPGPATHLLVTGPTSVTAGTKFNVTVTALDALNNQATAYSGAVKFTSTDPKAVLPKNYTFTSTDYGTHTFSDTLKTATTLSIPPQSITATDTLTGSVTGSQTGIVVHPGVAKILVVSGFPMSIMHGTPGTLTVTAMDAFGNVATGYLGTIKFSSTDPIANLPANFTFTSNDAGVHTFTNETTLNTIGTQSITATDTHTATIKGTESGIMVTEATPEELYWWRLVDPDDLDAIPELDGEDIPKAAILLAGGVDAPAADGFAMPGDSAAALAVLFGAHELARRRRPRDREE
jgi:titin